MPLIACTIIHIVNTFLKVKLNRSRCFINLGIKQGVCVVVFLLTYIILMLIGRNNIIDAVLFVLSVIALFSIYETTLYLVEWLQSKISVDKNDDERIIKKLYLSKIISADNEWDNSSFDNDEISKMLYEFINISNDNQMGHVVIRSMTTVDKDNVEKLCVKAKEGYHVIIRGSFEQISAKCSDVLFDGKLTEINEEIINGFKEKFDRIESADKIVCAFKEIKDINAEEENNFILAGCGIFDYEIQELPVKKQELKVAENYKGLITNMFSLLIISILIASDVFASLFDAVVFNCNAILTSGVALMILTSVISCCGEFKCAEGSRKYITVFLSVVSVCISYFFGRYVMLNSDYANDLFFVVTANVMANVTVISYIILTVLISVKYFTNKTKIISVLLCLLLLTFTFLPIYTKAIQGYNINYIFISVALLISIISVAICKIINFFLRTKNNGK